MTLLERYISTSILKGCVLVLLILLAIFSFMDVVQQLDDVGKGGFKTADAFRYVLLSAPARALEIIPMATLIGTVVALGLLNKGSELIAMRASGVSIYQISYFVIKTGVMLMLVVALISQFVAPPIQQYAEKNRLLTIAQSGDLLKNEGFWSRDGEQYLNIKQLLQGQVPTDISIFKFNEQQQLTSYIHAQQADTENPKSWILQDITLKDYSEAGVTTAHLPQMTWKPFSALVQLGRIELPPQSLAPYKLYKYVEHLRLAGENSQRFEIMFWQKAMLPLSVGALMLLALPFSFGSLRSASFGLRIVLGVVAGLMYSLINQLMGNLGLLLELNPALMAAVPVALVVVVSLQMLRTVR